MRRLLVLLPLLACKGDGKKADPVKTMPGDLVIQNVTVVPMDRDTTLPNQTVVIRGDKIVAITKADAVALDAAATKIDGTGKWLMPGLADMHVHTWTENDLPMFVAAGVTTVRNMYGGEQHLTWRKDIAAGKKLGPTIVTASPILDGDPPVWPGSVVLTKPDEVDNVVAGLKGQGYDFLKPYARLEKPVYDAVVQAAKKHGMTLQGHVPKPVGLAHVVASGQKSVEHLDGWIDAIAPPVEGGDSYWKRTAALVAKADETKIPALANDMKKAQTWNCATLIVMSRFAELDDVAALEKRIKWLPYISQSVRAMWNPKSDFRLQSATAEDYKAMRDANALREKIVRVLATSGAPMIVGTDTGNPYVLPGEGMHDEIELLVKAGAPRPRVMRAATADAGTFLGMPGALGVVSVGARADLLLVSVDPMTTALPLVPEGVVLGGKWLPKTELEAKLAAILNTAAGDWFEDVPPLAPEGKDVKQTLYKVRRGDKEVGEERIAVGTLDGKRVIVAQSVIDMFGKTEIGYRIAPKATRTTVKGSIGSLVLDAKVEGGKLVASGTLNDKPLSLSEPMPADAFISAPGIGGSLELVEKLGDMKVGDKRSAKSVELGYFPKPAIELATYDVERAVDTGGKRTFAITYHFPSGTITSELQVDANGIAMQSFGAPLNFRYERAQ